MPAIPNQRDTYVTLGQFYPSLNLGFHEDYD